MLHDKQVIAKTAADKKESDQNMITWFQNIQTVKEQVRIFMGLLALIAESGPKTVAILPYITCIQT